MSSAVPRTARPPAVLDDIDWHTYTRLLRVFQGQRRLRMTYDRGTLEMMSPLLRSFGKNGTGPDWSLFFWNDPRRPALMV